MRDRYETNNIDVRALAEGTRTIRNHSVSIMGERFGGVCLAGMNGQKIIVKCCDQYGLEYSVWSEHGKRIGDIRYLSEKAVANHG